MAEATGLGVEDAIIKPQYMFTGYDPRSHVHLPHSYGDEYPAFHTYKGALDLLIIDLMRPKQLRPLSEDLQPLHQAKRFANLF